MLNICCISLYIISLYVFYMSMQRLSPTLAFPKEFIEGAARLRGGAKALDIWRMAPGHSARCPGKYPFLGKKLGNVGYNVNEGGTKTIQNYPKVHIVNLNIQQPDDFLKAGHSMRYGSLRRRSWRCFSRKC